MLCALSSIEAWFESSLDERGDDVPCGIKTSDYYLTILKVSLWGSLRHPVVEGIEEV